VTGRTFSKVFLQSQSSLLFQL